MQPSLARGFTLVELMIVVTITGILAALAVPVYHDYIARTQVSEAVSLASGQKSAVIDYHVSHGAWPGDNATANLPAPADIKGKYVQAVHVQGSAVSVQIVPVMASSGVASGLAGTKMLLKGEALAGGAYEWRCESGNGGMPAKYLPASCRH